MGLNDSWKRFKYRCRYVVNIEKYDKLYTFCEENFNIMEWIVLSSTVNVYRSHIVFCFLNQQDCNYLKLIHKPNYV